MSNANNSKKILYSIGAIIKDNGTMADMSKKVTLYLNELDDENLIALDKLVKEGSVDVIIVPNGLDITTLKTNI